MARSLSPAPQCRPYTTSHFAVEHRTEANGIRAEIRRFGWDRSADGVFEADSYYIDYALMPRSPRSRLFYPDRRHTPPPGETVFLPRGSRFAAHSDPCEQRLLCMTFDHQRALGLFENDERAVALAPCFDVRAPRVRAALTRLAEEVREPGFGHDVLLESLALSLVVELCRHLRERQATDSAPRGRIADWRLRRLRERIHADLGATLSMPDLAAECGMSPRHLIRTFKNTLGMTLSDYIATARIDRAKEELGREDAMIKVIAHRCGFQSAAAFSSAFRRATGVTPRAFREGRHRLAS